MWNDYVFLGASALQVIDVADPTKPTKVGELENLRMQYLTVWGNRLVGGMGGNLVILDITELPGFRTLSVSKGLAKPV